MLVGYVIIDRVCSAKQETDSLKRRIVARLVVEESRLVPFQVDTGATCNILRLCDMSPEAEIHTDEPSTLAYYNGTHSKALGACKLKLTNLANGRDYVQGFQVVNHGSMSLIGVAAAEELELVTCTHREHLHKYHNRKSEQELITTPS